MNAKDAICKATGMKPKVWDDIVAKVKENSAKLERCTGSHDFQPINGEKLFAKHRCTRCGGEIDAINASWYKKGLKHAA